MRKIFFLLSIFIPLMGYSQQITIKCENSLFFPVNILIENYSQPIKTVEFHAVYQGREYIFDIPGSFDNISQNHNVYSYNIEIGYEDETPKRVFIAFVLWIETTQQVWLVINGRRYNLIREWEGKWSYSK